MAKSGTARSTVTGRFVPRSSATRSPQTTVVEKGPNNSSGTHHRSGITGRFIGPAAAARWPNTSITEKN